VLDYKEGEWLKALKNVTMNEPFFQGHFPGEPIMPGVLIVEALAQTGGLLAFLGDNMKNKLAIFMTINKAKFRKPVIPGDQLILDVVLQKKLRKNIAQVHGKASVDGTTVCDAELMFSIIDKDKM
jgi:UDP-3-O-[3-hydroxymyristoyl] N-acetylglucosamine deacetylase/3-hydroxyacyl-[acyl-carrier-protein] dehydratase